MAAPQHRYRLLRNIFRLRDVLIELCDAKLIKRYCVDSAGILLATDLVIDALSSNTKRRNSLTPEMTVITTLRTLPLAKCKCGSSDDLGPSHPAISRAIVHTIDALPDINMCPSVPRE